MFKQIIQKNYFGLSNTGNGKGNGNPLQYSCLENPMDRGAWKAVVHGVVKSQTRLSDFTFTHWRRRWQPTPVLLPRESQGQRSLVGCHLWGRTESDRTEVTQQHPILGCQLFYTNPPFIILLLGFSFRLRNLLPSSCLLLLIYNFSLHSFMILPSLQGKFF